MKKDSDTEDLEPVPSRNSWARFRSKVSDDQKGGMFTMPLTLRSVAIVIMLVGGPIALANAALASYDRWKMIEKHERELETIRSLVGATFKLQCKLCFHSFGAQAKVCGVHCEDERPLFSE